MQGRALEHQCMKSETPNVLKPETESAMEAATKGLSVDAKVRFKQVWLLIARDIKHDSLTKAREAFIACFTKSMREATLGDERPETGAAAQGRWDELLGMWVLTRGYPMELDHAEIAKELLRTKGQSVASEYLERAKAFEEDWQRLRACHES